MPDKPQHIVIAGAGLVGSLAAIYIARRGYRVSVFERRGDMRKELMHAGRSINLALSSRGLRALKEVGLDDEIKKAAIPMNGRMMHDVHGNLTALPYGKQGQYINSISRSALNIILLNAAEKSGAQFFFNHKCTRIDLELTSLEFEAEGKKENIQADYIIGADGSWSSVRTSMQHRERFSYSQTFIDHGYKEFNIPAAANGQFKIEKNALHIWPRQSFMMIGLPNPDGSFTGTLFYPWEGKESFATLKTDTQIKTFFASVFPDFVELAPDFLLDFRANPTGSLATIQCWPWVCNNTVILGDAAHGIVPFYGQGMNAGFEDVRILNDLLTSHSDNWQTVLDEFQHQRKPNADAIAQLALANFIEMRDLVADADFLLRKKIESHLHDLFPDRWIPLYSMVTFHDDIRYADALATGVRQKAIMDEVMSRPNIETEWSGMDFSAIVDRL